MRIWLDTDIGTDVDDALALAYVLRHPDLELVGISTVFGDLEIRNALVEAVLAAAAVDDVPIFTGLSVPLTPGRHGLMFGHEGRAVLDAPEPVRRIEIEPGGADAANGRVAAIATALEAAKVDRIVAIGPLTNLAALANAGADLAPLVIMGGRFDASKPSGVSKERPEWNWYCDPVAVQQLLALGERLDATVVPAEVTYQTRLQSSDIERLAGGDALTQLLAALSHEWLRAQAEDFDLPEPKVVLHDPLAAAVVPRPELCSWTDQTITVDDRGESTIASTDAGTTIRAATDVDNDAIVTELLTILGCVG